MQAMLSSSLHDLFPNPLIGLRINVTRLKINITSSPPIKNCQSLEKYIMETGTEQKNNNNKNKQQREKTCSLVLSLSCRCLQIESLRGSYEPYRSGAFSSKFGLSSLSGSEAAGSTSRLPISSSGWFCSVDVGYWKQGRSSDLYLRNILSETSTV